MSEAPPSPSTQKKRDINEAVATAMVRYNLEREAVTAKSARLRSLREAHEAAEAEKVKVVKKKA